MITPHEKFYRPNEIGTSPSYPRLAEEAFYGLPGRIVGAIEPHTEADRVAVLASLLAAFTSSLRVSQ